jgi:hypothetical protein
MSDDRKYRQRGYQEYDRGQRSGPPQRGADGRPASLFTAFKSVVRCDGCGAELPPQFTIGPESRCGKCQAPLHTCRTCARFTPGSPLDCAHMTGGKITDRGAANTCLRFEPRVVQVKETSFRSSPTPDQARAALENLFRKK